jgi:PII-like signaling protein
VRTEGMKLMVYFGERQRTGDGTLLADALLSAYERHGIHTSVLLRGADGFGAHHHLHTDRLLTASETLPAVSIAIDTTERIDGVLEHVHALVGGDGLVTLERAVLLTEADIAVESLPPDPEVPVKFTLYGGRRVRSDGQAGYVTAIGHLAENGVSGASALLAVDGTLHGERRRARFFARNAEVPLMLLTLGTSASIASSLSELVGLLDDPVATVERVQICRADGASLSDPLTLPQERTGGLPNWEKITVHVEEQATHAGHPVHSQLLLGLREAGAAGATVLRGVRGFYGAREPFADRLLSLRRNVPVLVVAIDRPDGVRRWWPVVDEVTREHGLVTSELVPTSFTAS